MTLSIPMTLSTPMQDCAADHEARLHQAQCRLGMRRLRRISMIELSVAASAGLKLFGTTA